MFWERCTLQANLKVRDVTLLLVMLREAVPGMGGRRPERKGGVSLWMVVGGRGPGWGGGGIEGQGKEVVLERGELSREKHSEPPSVCVLALGSNSPLHLSF